MDPVNHGALRALVETLSRSSNGVSELVVRDRGRFLKLSVSEIDWLSAEDNYVRIHANGRSHLVRGTIVALERDLDPERFIRIHRSAIVNIDRAREVRQSLRGGYAIVLGTGEKLRVSRAHRKQVTQMFTSRPRPADAVCCSISPE
jgi:two-component system LytT family response regulator